MRILIATDSFKGSLTSREAGEALRAGIRKILPEAAVSVVSVADGGEGTVEALLTELSGTPVTVQVTGPLGDPVSCTYGIAEKEGLAVIEMAQASGLTLIPEEKRDPLCTTSYGVGEVIRDALERGCRSFLLGIGGSATNDMGLGMLSALGLSFLDRKGEPVPWGGLGLKELVRIETKDVMPELAEARFRIACDVTNPLLGEQGASRIFGPQKGASPEDCERMDAWMADCAALAQKTLGEGEKTDPMYPGTGAAGGLGYAFRAFLNGELAPGIGIVLDILNFDERLKEADLVITGEGRLDAQSLAGKTPVGIAGRARVFGLPVLAVAGTVQVSAEEYRKAGIDAAFSAMREGQTLAQAMEKETAKANLTAAGEQAALWWKERSRE